MKTFARTLLGIGLLVLVLLGAVALALQAWVGSDDFRGRIERQASAALGVDVSLGRVSVDLFPLPAVGLDAIRLKTQPPLTLHRVEARPVWLALLQGRLEVATLVVRNAVLPQQALVAIAAALQKKERSVPAARGLQPENATNTGWWPRRALLDHVSWVDDKGVVTVVDAQAALADDGLPESGSLKVLKGRLQGTKAMLQRQPDHWAVRVEVGGGTLNGKLQIGSAKGRSLLQGRIDTRNVELAALTAPSRTLSGRLDAQTSLRAEFRDLGGLADALQTQSRFNVRNAVVHGIDLAQAVKTVGLNRSGETRLETLAGNVSTQGRAGQLSNLVATSGVLAASGQLAVAGNRSLSGRVTVDLASTALGVPLVVGGTLDAPTVTLSRGGLLGAAVTPGAGTPAAAPLGERLGGGLRSLFGK